MTAETSSRLRLVVSLLVLGFAAVGLFFVLRTEPPPPRASAEFERIRDSILTGDHRALWRSMDGVGRAAFVEYVQRLNTSAPKEEVDLYCQRVSISRKELAELPADDVLAREIGASADVFQGSRVVKAYPQPDHPEEELLQLGFRDGRDRWWHMVLTDGVWNVRSVNALATLDGVLTRGPELKVPVGRSPPSSLGGGGR
jgi:hypothetical protein